MIKILLKEIIHINSSDKVLFILAPFCDCRLNPGLLRPSLCQGLHAIDFNIGIFYLLAVSSLGIIGILLAGWSSNNKYTMIGAMRSGAQLISYELSAALALMTIVVLSGQCNCLRLSSSSQSCGLSLKDMFPLLWPLLSI